MTLTVDRYLSDIRAARESYIQGILADFEYEALVRMYDDALLGKAVSQEETDAMLARIEAYSYGNSAINRRKRPPR